MRNKLVDLLIQIIAVMIGVFLAFLISDWSANNREKDRSDLLIKNIAAEIRTNRQKVEQVLDYHRMLRDSSRYHLQESKMAGTRPGFFKGVRTLILVNSAFETGIQTGSMNSISIDKIQALNEVYTQQRSYDDFAKLLLSGLITMDFDESEKTRRRVLTYLSISMTDVVIKEEQLLKDYQNTLELLEK